MLKVTIKKYDNLIVAIDVKGHANYAEYGHDIVCAGASAITVGGIAAILDYDKNAIDYRIEEGNLSINVKDFDEVIQIILNTIVIQLKVVEQEHSKNLKITVKEEKKC